MHMVFTHNNVLLANEWFLSSPATEVSGNQQREFKSLEPFSARLWSSRGSHPRQENQAVGLGVAALLGRGKWAGGGDDTDWLTAEAQEADGVCTSLSWHVHLALWLDEICFLEILAPV